MPREIETLSGTAYQPDLSAARWTSTSGQWSARAPFAGRGMGGLGACGCGLEGCGCGCSGGCGGSGAAGLGATTLAPPKPLIFAYGQGSFLGASGNPPAAGEQQKLQVGLFLFGKPPFDVQRAADVMQSALRALGLTAVKTQDPVAYPLAWDWLRVVPKNDEPGWAPVVTNASAGPFQAMLSNAKVVAWLQDPPTLSDTQKLGTQGVALWTEGVRVVPLTDLESKLAVQTLRQSVAEVLRSGPLTTDAFFSMYYSGAPAAKSGSMVAAFGLGLLALLLLSDKDKDQIRYG